MFKKLTQAEPFGIFSIPWGVFVLALAIRVAYIFQIETSPLFAYPPVDGLTYVEHAQDLASGNWLEQGREAFWQPPLYPYVLGLLYALSPDLFFYAVRFFQALCGAVLCVLTWSLGRQLFNPAVGAAAACAAALYGPLIFFDGEILPATMGTFLNMAGLALLLRALRRPSFFRFAGAGLVFGLAVLTVATVLSFALGAAIYVCYEIPKQNRSLRLPSAFLLGLLLAIAPVTLRNYAIGGDAVLISSNAGINFYLGNNPDYQRTVNIRPGWEWYELLNRAKVEAQAERLVQQSDFYLDKAREYIVAQPVDYLVLLAQKTHLFWQGDEIGRNQDLYFWRHYTAILSATMWKWGIAFPFGLVGPLALVGLALAIRQRAFSLPLLFVVLYPFRHRLFRNSALSPAGYSPAAGVRRLWWVLRCECPAAAPFPGCCRHGRGGDLLSGVRQCGSGTNEYGGRRRRALQSGQCLRQTGRTGKGTSGIRVGRVL